MANYSWDIEGIKKNRRNLKRRIKNAKDIEYLELLKFTIEQYDDMLNTVNDSYKIRDEDELTVPLLIDEFYEDFSQDDYKISKIIQKTYPIIKDIDLEFEKLFHQDNYKIKEAFTITHDFFKEKTDKTTFKEFCKLMKTPGLLEISDNLTTNQGSAHIDFVYNKKYTCFTPPTSLMAMPVIPHEFFHLIFVTYQSWLSLYNTMLYTCEIEGFFAELLFSDYLNEKKILTTNEINKLDLANYINNVDTLLTAELIKKHLDNNQTFDLTILNKEANKYKMLFESEDMVKDSLDEDSFDVLKYSFSYLGALDLYYLEDREKAFYNLRGIRSEANTKNIQNTMEKYDMNFISNNYKNLRKQIKTINE